LCPILSFICHLNPDRDSFMWGSYPASLWNIGGSTPVPVNVWNNARRGTWGLPPPVSWNIAKWPILCWCDVKSNQRKQTFVIWLLTYSWFPYILKAWAKLMFEKIILIFHELIFHLQVRFTNKKKAGYNNV
jgi:hypothetical protein